MLKLLRVILSYLKTLVKMVLFPKFKGTYYYFSGRKIYMAPSISQIGLIRKYLKAKWKHERFLIVQKALGVMNVDRAIILDIGANVGYVATVYSHLLRKYKGRVISFEPVSMNSLAFLWNTKNLDNIQLFTFGLGATSECISLGIPAYAKRLKKDVENTGLLSASAEVEEEVMLHKSSSYSLDAISSGMLGERDSVVFVKIDVEGYELRVITGAIKTIRAHMPLIEVEFNPMTTSRKDAEKILTSLYALGYVTFSEGKFNFDEPKNVFFVNDKDTNLVSMFQSFDNLFSFDVSKR